MIRSGQWKLGLLLAGASAAVAGSTSAQTADTKLPPATATIAVDARLVNLPVVVHDKKGALVQNLSREDFVLEVDGHPQPIRYFDRDRDLPLTLGLLVDTSRSVASVLDDERTASAGFLEGMLATPKDQAFIIQFAHSTELLQDTTNSRPKLQAALKEIDTDSPGTRSQPDDTGSDPRKSRGGTTLYDAAFLASDELMAKQSGRKALILLTDGDDRGSKESLVGAIEAAQRANTILYAIYFKGQQSADRDRNGGTSSGGGGGGRRGGIGFPGGGGGYPGGGGGRGGGGNGGNRPQESRVDGKKILERMTAETGGRVFEISRKDPIAAIYGQIADELRSQYRLGFTPDKDTAAQGYHHIDLTLPRGKNTFVQTRDGYYTGADPTSKAAANVM